MARDWACQQGVVIDTVDAEAPNFSVRGDVVVDALLGTGIVGEVRAGYRAAFAAVTLGQASCHYKELTLSSLLGLGQFQNGINGFLSGTLDKTASVYVITSYSIHYTKLYERGVIVPVPHTS